MSIEAATNVEKLKKWQDAVLEHAKKLLMKNGSLAPIFMVLTERMNIPLDMLKSMVLMDPNTMAPAKADEGSPDDVLIITMSTFVPPDVAIQILVERHPDPKFKKYVDMLNAIGMGSNIEDHHEILLKVMLRMLNLEFQDVVAMAIKLVLRKMEAAAVIKVDECWAVHKERKPGDTRTDAELRAESPADLGDDPNAVENIVVSLESDKIYRVVSTTFHRNKPKTGEVIGFGDVMITEPGEGVQMKGRFTHLLSKAKGRAKPQPQPGAQ